MFARSIEVVGEVWVHSLLGTALVVVAAGAGWVLAGDATRLALRGIVWWMRRVALPLIRIRSPWRRAVGIFVNNGLILAMLVLLGRWPVVSLLAVAALGISLGAGLRLLCAESIFLSDVDLRLKENSAAARRFRIGLALNLLEPPAIMLAVGICLARAAIPLDAGAAWSALVVWVLPASLIAATGEAIWIGAVSRPTENTDLQDPP